MNKRMPWCNFFMRSFTNGTENQGEYTFPGYRVKSKFVCSLGFDNVPKNKNEYEQIGAGYLFWYDNFHVIMRPHPKNDKKVTWGISNERICSNKYGYYPEGLPFCSKRQHLIKHIQRAIRWHKRYKGNAEDLLKMA